MKESGQWNDRPAREGDPVDEISDRYEAEMARLAGREPDPVPIGTPTTVACPDCDWSVEGDSDIGMELLAEHRDREHEGLIDGK